MLSIPVIAMASISLYAGLYHLLIYVRSRYFRAHLTFSILCLTVVAYDVFCVGLYSTTSSVDGAHWQRLQFLSLALFVPAFLWFAADYTNQKPGRAIYIYSAFYVFAFLVQLVDRSSFTFLVDQPSIKNIPFAGQTITYFEAVLGPFSVVQSFMGLIASTSILVMGYRYYRSGHKREALPLILVTGLMYIAGFHDTLVSNGMYQFIYLMEYAYLATILMMTWSLSSTVVDAAIAREELRKSEERFRSMVETTSDWVWEVDVNGRYTYASPRVRDLLGYEPEEVLGYTPFDFMLPAAAQEMGRIFRTTIQNHGVFERVENNNLRKDGQLVVLETSGIPFFNERGELGGYRGIDRDITKRRQAEEDLKESEERFRSIVENALAGIFIIDDAYHFVYVNDELCHILRYPSEELLGLDFRTVLTEESRALVADRYLRKQRGEETPSRYEFNIICRDGEIRVVEMNVTVVGDKTGKPRSMGQLIDITDRKRAEEQLQESVQRLQTVVNGAPIVLFSVDRQGKFTLSEGKGLGRLDAVPGELVGKSIFDFFRDDPEALANMQRALSGESFTTLLSLPGGTVFEASHIAMRDPAGECTGTIGLLVDITERKQMEDKLRESRNILQTVLDTIPARVFWKDTNLNYLGCNRSFALDAGFQSPREVIGHDDYEMGWLDQADLYRNDDLQVIKSDQPKLGYEELQTTPDGGQIWLLTNKVPLRDADGKTRGVLGTYEDITVRKRAEEALTESEEKFRSIVENSLAGIFKVDNSYRFVYVNDELCRILAYPKEKLLGLDFRKVLSANSRALVEDRYVRRQRGEDVPSRYELEVVRLNGEVRHAEMIVNVVSDMYGKPSSMGQLIDITERNQAEDALRRSQQMLRTILDQFPGVVFWKDRQSVYLGCNQAFSTASGLASPMEITGKTDLDLPWAETEAMSYRAEDLEVMESGQPRLGIIEPQHQSDGRLAWFDTSKVPLVDELGNVIGVLGASRDITEQVLTLHALQETEFFLNRSQQVAQIGSYKLDIRSGCWESSPSLDDILGIDEAFVKDVTGWLTLVVAEDRETMRDYLLRHVLTERQRFEKEYRIVRPIDHEVRWMFGLGELEFDEAGSPVRMIGTIQDITERRQIEDKLRVSEERLQQAVRISDIGIFDHDQITEAIYWSPEVRKDFGLSQKENFSLQDFIDQLHPDDLAGTTAAIRQAHDPAGDGSYDVEFRFVRRNGEVRWIAAKSRTFFAGEGDGRHPIRTIGALIDITDRKRTEEERETLIKELEAKNAELERFTYTVSHDLKAPLVTIKGFLGYIENDARTGNMDRLSSDLRRISDAVERMRVLLKDLLELSRVGRFFNPSDDIRFGDLANEAIGLVEGAIRERHITIKLQSDLPSVYGDRQRLVEVLQNLLDNASKFMGDQPEPTIEIGQAGRENENYIFFVRDNGIGFASEYREHVFGLFNKLDPNSEGTGIGLALVKRIIEVHGGRVWVESEPGKGATFYFMLTPARHKTG